jgi:hypothetical protein
MLTALRFGDWGSRVFLEGQYPPASRLSPLERAFARLGLAATETYFRDDPQVTPDDALTRLSSIVRPEVRRTVIGFIAGLVVTKMNERNIDEETLALRQWATQLWRNHKIAGAKATLDEYLKWQNDPCGYEKKPAAECQTMANLFTTRTPPEHTFASKALESMFAKSGTELAATAGVIAGGLSAAAATALLASAIGTPVVAGAGASGAVLTSIGAAMGMGGKAGLAAASLGSAFWAGFAGGPVTAGLLIAIVGTTEGFKVVNAARVEPMLRAQVGKAMTQPIVIENELASQEAKDFFFLSALNAGLNRFVIPKNTVDGEIRFYNQAGYVSRLNLTYRLAGTTHSLTTANLKVGDEQTLTIPADATGISVKVEWFDGGTWRELKTFPHSTPTMTGYTTYGTVFGPAVKNEYPEISNIQQAAQRTLTITHGGGYVARINLSYARGGKTVLLLQHDGLTAGWRQDFQIPSDATNIYMEAFSSTGWVGEPWKAVFVKTWPSPPSECIKIYGTTLDPRWNNECK